MLNGHSLETVLSSSRCLIFFREIMFLLGLYEAGTRHRVTERITFAIAPTSEEHFDDKRVVTLLRFSPTGYLEKIVLKRTNPSTRLGLIAIDRDGLLKFNKRM